MSYRIVRSTLALTIIIITFAHKKASCNAQITDVTSSSAGNKFVVGFPRNNGQRADELFVFITNSESSAVNFIVTPININGTVSNSSTRVNVPSSFEVLSVNERNKGILVEADGNINVYGLSFHEGTADAYLALPCSKMAVDEYEYYGISYDIFSSAPSVILLVACENETVVKFNSSTITLNSMETYQIESDNDLTGTRITSSKPLSVFSGSDCAEVPQGIFGCDHLVEQVPPTVTWGSKFLVASLEGRSSGERIRVLSARAASVTVNCNTVVSVGEFQLHNGGSFREFEIPINSFCSIESTSPVLVAQYAYGRESNGMGGDPFMMIIPPIEQFTNNYFVEAFPLFAFNYVTVYVSSEFFQIAQILLDNSVVTGWRNVVCSSGEICGHISRTNVSTGVHSIRHQNSSAVLGVSVYGFIQNNAYGYPGGMRLSPIQCICGQNSICLNNMGQFNCTCLNGFFASFSRTDELVCNGVGALSVAALSGGLVAIVVVLILLVAVFLLVVTITKKRKRELLYERTNRQLSGNEAPAGPVYEEVGLAMTPRTQDIQVESNEAYGETARRNIELQSNQAYGEDIQVESNEAYGETARRNIELQSNQAYGEDIQIESNEAYGETARRNIELQSNQAYGEDIQVESNEAYGETARRNIELQSNQAYGEDIQIESNEAYGETARRNIELQSNQAYGEDIQVESNEAYGETARRNIELQSNQAYGEDIQIESNEAYGETARRNIELQSNQAYGEIST